MSNKNQIIYRKVGDYNIPNLALPPEEANIKLGKWGLLHKNYLLKYKKILFFTLLTEGKLWRYLADIDTQAQQMFDTLVEQMKVADGVTEQLKEENQLEWVACMNIIQLRAKEIVYEKTDLYMTMKLY